MNAAVDSKSSLPQRKFWDNLIWDRFIAFSIDFLCIIVLAAPILGTLHLTGFSYEELHPTSEESSLGTIMVGTVFYFYKTLFEYFYGQTPGKKLMGLYVDRASLSKAAFFNRCVFRNLLISPLLIAPLLEIIPVWVLLFIPYPTFCNSSNSALHDLMTYLTIKKTDQSTNYALGFSLLWLSTIIFSLTSVLGVQYGYLPWIEGQGISTEDTALQDKFYTALSIAEQINFMMTYMLGVVILGLCYVSFLFYQKKAPYLRKAFEAKRPSIHVVLSTLAAIIISFLTAATALWVLWIQNTAVREALKSIEGGNF